MRKINPYVLRIAAPLLRRKTGRKAIWLVHTLFLLGISTQCCLAQKFPSDPEQAQIFTSDLVLFWAAFDKLMEDSSLNPFEDYLLMGSAGLKDFIPNRIVSAVELKKLVLSEKKYYSKIRSSTLRAIGFEKRIRAAYYALKYVYPAAVFPPIYFVIGRTTSGGTASGNGLIIGTESFSDTIQVTNYGRPTLQSDLIPAIVAHEIIHFLQTNVNEDSSLLKESIREGSGDFLAELVAGSEVKKLNGDDVYPFGDKNEKLLWSEFRATMYDSKIGPWLYSQVKERPQNLGYWMGYKIVEAYYKKTTDKKKAIKDILNIRDYRRFLVDSGYAETSQH